MLRRGCGEADRVAGRARRAGRAAPGSGPRRAVGPLLGRADRAAGPDPGRADPGLGAVPRRGDAVRGGDQPAAARGADSAGNADRRRRRRRGRRGRAGIGGGPSVLALIKTDPGNVSLESMLTEIDKLLAVRAVGVPAEVFADVAPRVLAGWRAQAAVESPSHLRAHPNPAKTLTLLAALLHIREREITDTLVELLIATVHRINARAEKMVTAELINAFKKVTDKENILFSIAEASLAAPEEKVRRVVYPAIAGGEATLRELVHEYRTKGPVYRTTVATTLRASYRGRFPAGRGELADEVVEFVAKQVGVAGAELGFYDWSGRQDQGTPVGDPWVAGFPGMLRRGCGEADRVAGRARRAGRAAPGSGPRRAVGPLLGRADRSRRAGPGSSGSWPRRCTKARRRCSRG